MPKVATLFSDQERDYPKGQILLYQAEQTSNVFRIKSGYVKVYDISSEGQEKLLIILGKGDIYPLVWTFGASDKLLYFYEAMSDATIEVASRQELMNAIDADHALTKELLKYFVNHTKELMLRIECLEASNAKFKVAQVLDYLVGSHSVKKGKNTQVCAPITHQNIADMAGLTRETTSIQMKELEKVGVIKQDSDGLIVSSAKLAEFMEQE